MVVLAKKADTMAEARTMLEESIKNGRAIDMFKTFVEAQGGNAKIVDEPSLLPSANFQLEVKSETSGYVTKLIADKVGKAVLLLGAGRQDKDSVIDLSVGAILHKKLGDSVTKGDTLFTIHTNLENNDEIVKMLLESIEIGQEKVQDTLIIKIIE